MSKTLSGTVLALAIAAAIPATALTTDAPMTGDWDCGNGLRVYITQFGSIEILGGEPSYRAGLIDVIDDLMTVTWEEGGTTDVTWALDGNTLTLAGLTGDEPLTCTPRD